MKIEHLKKLSSSLNDLENYDRILNREKSILKSLENPEYTSIDIRIGNINSLYMEDTVPLIIVRSLVDSYFNAIKLKRMEILKYLTLHGIDLNEKQS